MNNLKRNEKGITLIALIITIVVLLILAVVAIGQAQESNIVGYAQNASSKYEQAQNNEVNLLATYETTLETLSAEKLVLEFDGIRVTILPKTGKVISEGYYNGKKVTLEGTFTLEEVTQDLINALAEGEMPTNASDYQWGINVIVPGADKYGYNTEGLILVTDESSPRYYCYGERMNVITVDVSNDTMRETINKYTNTIGNTVGNNEI